MTWKLIIGLTLTALIQCLEAETLNFPQAVQALEKTNRALMAADAGIQMRLSEAWQSGLYPNPLFTFEVDNFGGSHYFRGFKHSDYSWSLTQPFELGGKRSARQDIALASVYKSYWNYQSLRQSLINDLEKAFICSSALEEQFNLAIAQHQMALDTSQYADERAEAGKIPFYQKSRARIACHTSLLHLESIKTAIVSSHASIVNIIGNGCLCLDAVRYPLRQLIEPVPYCVYEENLHNNPLLAAAMVDTKAAASIYALERASRIPDLDVTAKVSSYREVNDTAFSLEFSIPLPIFNQNQGNISRSNWQIAEASYIEEDLEGRLTNDLKSAYQKLIQAYDTAISFQGELEKCAKETLEAAQEEHRRGKIELHDLLEAHKTCMELQNHYIEVLKEYHLRRVEVENIAPSSI